MPKTHSFLLRSSFGPAEVLALLKRVTENPKHRNHTPAFEFDWLKRRAALSAATMAGVDALTADLRKGLRVAKVGEDALLIGRMVESSGGRREVPIGIAVMEPAAYAQLIAQSLGEAGVVGVKWKDTPEGCRLDVPVTFMMGGLPYDELVMGFPVPPYVRIEDRGLHDAPKKGKRKRRSADS